MITNLTLLLKIFFNPKLAIGLYLIHNIDERGQVIAGVKSGKIIYANRPFLEHIGRSIIELRETPFIEFVAESSKGDTSAIVETLKHGLTVYDFENDYVRPDGTVARCVWRSIIFNGLYACTVKLKK